MTKPKRLHEPLKPVTIEDLFAEHGVEFGAPTAQPPCSEPPAVVSSTPAPPYSSYIQAKGGLAALQGAADSGANEAVKGGDGVLPCGEATPGTPEEAPTATPEPAGATLVFRNVAGSPVVPTEEQIAALQAEIAALRNQIAALDAAIATREADLRATVAERDVCACGCRPNRPTRMGRSAKRTSASKVSAVKTECFSRGAACKHSTNAMRQMR